MHRGMGHAGGGWCEGMGGGGRGGVLQRVRGHGSCAQLLWSQW